MSCASRAVSAPALGARRAVARAPGGGVPPRGASPRRGGARLGAPADADVVRAPRPEYIPSRIDDENYVRVFDTTLRDGEQSPGATARARTDRRPRPQTPLRTFLAPPRRKRRPESIPLSRPLAATAATDRRPATDRIHLARPARRVSHRLERRVEAAVPLLPSPPPPPPFSTRPLVRPPPRTASSSRVRFPNRGSRQARR